MRLKERAEVAIATAFIAGTAMFVAGIISFTVFLEFLYDEDGEIKEQTEDAEA